MKKPSTDPIAVELALADLLRQIAAGQEYPDAQWAVSHRLNVDFEALQRAYDDHCAGVRS